MAYKFFRNLIIFFFVLLSFSVFGQSYVLPNEEVVYSFNTQDGRRVTLNKDKKNNNIIFRFGTRTKVDLNIANKSKNNGEDFKYSFYLRGGGAKNEGIDLNYIYYSVN